MIQIRPEKKLLGHVTLLVAIACVLMSLNGCSTLTALADLNQHPPVTSYIAKQTQEKVFTSAVRAMGRFGKILSEDMKSGVVQGQKGNWRMNVLLSTDQKEPETIIQISARYIPSKTRMDFNTRQMVTDEYIKLFESELREKLILKKK